MHLHLASSVLIFVVHALQGLPGHYGLLGMEEQATLIGGEFSLQSSHAGTRISILFDV